MLLLTDRPGESARLQEALGSVERCSVAALDQALDRSEPHSLLVCDIALDTVAATELVQTVISHYRDLAVDTHILCLTRERSQVAFAQARAIGATAILPSQTHPAELAARVRHLIASKEKPQHRAVAHADDPIRLRVHEAGVVLATLFEAAHRRAPISAAALQRGGDAVIDALGRGRIRAWLDVVRRYDQITYQHCLLVAGLTTAFARDLGLSLSSQRMLSQAALIHDIGKAHIPRAILTKPKPLSTIETTVMRTHVTIGHALLATQSDFEPDLLDIVRHHHECLDGSGYPDQLESSELSQFVRMVTICDVYAALIERRSFRAPLALDVALAELVAQGPKLDMALVGAFGRTLARP